ncbi:MAG: xanthine dehydrogenase family protein subunit M [Alphaproteobacteria bacterium]
MIKDFLKPTSPQEAVSLKKQYQDSLYIGGGTWINSSYSKLNPEVVISLSNLNLSKFEINNDTLFIGSSVTIQDLIDRKDVPDVLKEAASHVGSRNIRNAATLGGSIGSGSPWFSLTPALLVLDTVLETIDDEGIKDIPLYDYLEADIKNLILTIKIPLAPEKDAKILKYTRTARTVPVIVAAASCRKGHNNDHSLAKPLIAIGGVASKPVLLTDLFQKLDDVQMPSRDELEKMISAAVSPKGDFRGGADFRKYMAGVLAANCLTIAFEGAKV